MTSTTDAKTAAPRPLTISRTFAAPRERVFACWSSAERMKRWFSPEGVDVPEAEIDCRPGGAFVICMRMPDGTEHWCRGAFGEVVPPERLTFDCEVSTGGKPGFLVRTLVLFADRRRGHADDGRAELRNLRPRVPLRGRGLGRRLAHDAGQAGARGRARRTAPAVRGAFTVERTFKATPAQVFKAFTDERAKSRWFAGGDGTTRSSSAAWTCGRAGARSRSANGRAA